MPDNKYLWRAKVRGVNKPVYLIAQNIQSAHAKLHTGPITTPEDTENIQRIDAWDDQQDMTVVIWPEPEPPPEPIEEPPE